MLSPRQFFAFQVLDTLFADNSSYTFNQDMMGVINSLIGKFLLECKEMSSDSIYQMLSIHPFFCRSLLNKKLGEIQGIEQEKGILGAALLKVAHSLSVEQIRLILE